MTFPVQVRVRAEKLQAAIMKNPQANQDKVEVKVISKDKVRVEVMGYNWDTRGNHGNQKMVVMGVVT